MMKAQLIAVRTAWAGCTQKKSRAFRAMLIGVLLLGFTSCSFGQTGKPNIIIILVDDMGYSDLGCTGAEIATPYRMAKAQEHKGGIITP